MNICPKCKAIIDETDDFCPECGEDLFQYDEDEMSTGFEPEILYMADNLAEAQAIVEFLRDNDIPATLIDSRSSVKYLTAMRPSSANSIPILVPVECVDQAHDMLEEYLAAVPDVAAQWEGKDEEEDDMELEGDDFDEEDDDEDDEIRGSQIA